MEFKLTSQQLADSAGVTKQTFSAWLNGKASPTAEAMFRWAKAYQLNINWLLTGEGDMYGGGGAKRPPTPHIDAGLLQQVIELLEEHLQAVKGKLTPAAKGVVIAQLYELIVEQEEQAREPIQMMRIVMGALAKAVNE